MQWFFVSREIKIHEFFSLFADEEEEEEENANDFDISDIQDQDEDIRQLNLHPNNEDERMKDESSPKNNIRVQSDQYDNEDLETDDVHPESPTNLEYQPEWKRLKTEYDDCVEYERRRRQENNYHQEEYFLEDPQNKRYIDLKKNSWNETKFIT